MTAASTSTGYVPDRPGSACSTALGAGRNSRSRSEKSGLTLLKHSDSTHGMTKCRWSFGQTSGGERPDRRPKRRKGHRKRPLHPIHSGIAYGVASCRPAFEIR